MSSDITEISHHEERRSLFQLLFQCAHFILLYSKRDDHMKAFLSSTTTTALALFLAGSSPHALAFSPIASPVVARMTAKPVARMLSPPITAMKNDNTESDSNGIAVRAPINPKPVLLSFMEELTTDKAHVKVAAASMALALAFLPLNADAAMSGGRMGGSFRAPRQSMSRPMSRPSPSSYNRGYSGGYSSRPSTMFMTPGLGYSPFFNPVVPYYGGPGAISYSRGPGLFQILFFGGVLYTAASVFSNVVSDTATSSFGDTSDSAGTSSLGPGASVVQLSVALEVPDRDDPNSILGALERLARTAKTDSRVGIQNLTSQVALELLRRRSSITSATSSNQHFRDRNKAGREFESQSIKERSKFEREAVSKYGGVDYSLKGSSTSTQSGDGKATMAVVTLLLNIDGDSTQVPKISSIFDVEEALRKIASDSKVDDCLQSAEILWTPEDRSETLSIRDVVADYPELRSI
jgi:uncharacterized membrane protein